MISIYELTWPHFKKKINPAEVISKLGAAMSAPTSEWGKAFLENFGALRDQFVQTSADLKNSAATQVKSNDELRLEVRGLTKSQLKVEQEIRTGKWVFGISLAVATVTFGVGIKVLSGLNFTVGKLEAVAEQHQLVLADLKQSLTDVNKSNSQVASLLDRYLSGKESSIRVQLAVEHVKERSDKSILFSWPFLQPISPDKASRTKVDAKFSANQQPLEGITVQISAEVSPDGKDCLIRITSKNAQKIDAYLQTKGNKVTVDLTLVVPQ